MTAVGSGGATGRGVAGATQTSLKFLPEHATDFAFASLAEQKGFSEPRSCSGPHLLVVWRGLKVVAAARDPFSAIAAGGIVFAFLFQILVNVGMTDQDRSRHRHPLADGQRRRLIDDRGTCLRSASCRRSTVRGRGRGRLIRL